MAKTKCGTLALVLVISSFIGIRAYAFKVISKKGHEVRWSSMPVKYYVGKNDPESFQKVGYDVIGEPVSFQDIISRAFDSWKNTSGVEVSHSCEGWVSDDEGGDDGKNQITFIRTGWKSLSFSPSSSALAVTVTTYETGSGKIVDSDIYFNDEYYNWSHIDTSQEYSMGVVDIQNVATHELGHLLGLGHSSESPYESIDELRSATMYYISGTSEVFRRTLDFDDQNAIKHLYPTADAEAEIIKPQVDSVYPGSGSNNGNPVQVTIKGSNFTPLTMLRLSGGDLVNDEVCKIISRSENEIRCVFDLYDVTNGQYDIIASNSYYDWDKLEDSFTVLGRTIEYEESSGGCGTIDETASKGGAVSLLGLIILIYPITQIFIRRKRLVGIPVRSHGDGRKFR